MAENLQLRDAADIVEESRLCKGRPWKKPDGRGVMERLRDWGRQAWILPENSLFLSRITNADRLV